MSKITYKLWKQAFPCVCVKCNNVLNMEREYCEYCGAKDSLRASNKSDYKEKYKNVKEL